MNSPVVVTGASGFVGRHVVRVLSREGIPTVALSRRPEAESFPGVRTEVVRRYADFVPQAGSALIHLAEPPHIAEVDAQGETHIAYMREQAAALLARNYARSVYVSSATVYGDGSDLPWRPDQPLLDSPKVYAHSKLAVEKQFLAANGVVARVTNLYGPGMSKLTIFSDILGQLGRAEPVTIRELTPVRDYLWIEDAAAALARMASGQHTGIYNVASGFAVACGELATLILKLAGESHRAVDAVQPARHSVLRLDISKTRMDFGWSPETELQSGIRMLLKSRPA